MIPIAFVADGYKRSERQKFLNRCGTAAYAIVTTAPFNEFAQKFSFFAFWAESAQSGVSYVYHGCSPTGKAIYKNTALGSAIGRNYQCNILDGNVLDVDEVVDHLYDYKVIVLANSDAYAGSSDGYIAWVAAHRPDFEDVMLHELGHSFGLHDEYEEDPKGPNPTFKLCNVTSNPKSQPWKVSDASVAYFGNKACPEGVGVVLNENAPAGAVGYFQGANYSSCGYYRSELTCKMRDVQSPFCGVCSALLKKEMKPL